MKKILTLTILSSLALTACMPKMPLIDDNKNNNLVACTLEAKICPDGTAVGRSGPNCEFQACPQLQYKTITSNEIANLTGPYTFTADIPAHWQVEAVPTVEGINIYDPNSPEPTNLNKSQIFIRYFSADFFLTLNTVEIYSRNEALINDRPAVVYDIEKKSEVALFTGQPFWRNTRHLVTDIRQTDDSPSIFYVIAKRPELNQEIFDNFIQSLKFNIAMEQKDVLIAPVADWQGRITKKPFGLYITPQNSPVSPEKFTGYHNAIDIEYEDVPTDVPVYAIAAGEVVRSGFVSGYGGMVAIRHNIDDKNYLAIYGHLDPNSLIANGAQISQGQQIGILGEGYTNETDGERKHLHFGIYTKEDVNIRGYVAAEADLSNWIDPLTLLP